MPSNCASFITLCEFRKWIPILTKLLYRWSCKQAAVVVLCSIVFQGLLKHPNPLTRLLLAQYPDSVLNLSDILQPSDWQRDWLCVASHRYLVVGEMAWLHAVPSQMLEIWLSHTLERWQCQNHLMANGMPIKELPMHRYSWLSRLLQCES